MYYYGPLSVNGFVVRAEGLEPPCLAALDPKSSASANFATPAVNEHTLFGKGSAKVKIKTRNYNAFGRWVRIICTKALNDHG